MESIERVLCPQSKRPLAVTAGYRAAKLDSTFDGMENRRKAIFSYCSISLLFWPDQAMNSFIFNKSFE